ncbi:hypothetical protein VZ94_14040 [Methylocucumis oryzae]|uniref:Solute-binding protein family 3/N-terminal domain-containing protein n=2 Tax=Methylocucumis oryzae TaxID=1632867 RepID=A0A0F3IHK2_9GAMM|nr:hypothetical protein VZ94_14040 [Methylocucumis oryzae]
MHTSIAGTVKTVYFYNPETSVDNFAALKTEFDSYLSGQGDYSFQPFSERKTFEQMLTGQNQGVYLLSSWHYAQLNAKTPLSAMLVGVVKGELLQRKILLGKDIASLDQLAGATIAGAGSDDYLRTQLQQMLATRYAALAPKIKILTVPKDIDALMSVGFGMATAAIASESSFNKLALMNPKQQAQLKILASGEKSFTLIAAVAKPQQQEEKPLLSVIEAMAQQPNGEKKLKMLGLDGWKRVDAIDPALAKQLR